MSTPILVTGGTGTLGRALVPRLRAAGQDVRVLSRHEHAAEPGLEYVAHDLRQEQGMAEVMAGGGVVVHLAGDARHDEQTTRIVVTAAAAAGVAHLVYISVTAADLIPIGYFRGKAASERVVAESGVPWTTLRAAQFHDLTLTTLQALAKLPVMPVPKMTWQPVDTDEVAATLSELVLGEPSGRVRDLVGPEELPMAELASAYLSAAGKRRVRVPLPLPGKVGRVYRNRDNLSPDADRGRRTWSEFLAQRFA